MIAVVIADEEEAVRRKLAAWIALSPDIILVGEAGGSRAAARLVRRLHPDAVVMASDISARGGVEAVREILSEGTSLRVVLFTSGLNAKQKAKFMEAGVDVCVSRTAPMETVVEAIRGERR